MALYDSVWTACFFLGVFLLLAALVFLINGKMALSDTAGCSFNKKVQEAMKPGYTDEQIAANYAKCVADAEAQLSMTKYLAIAGGAFLAIAIVLAGINMAMGGRLSSSAFSPRMEVL